MLSQPPHQAPPGAPSCTKAAPLDDFFVALRDGDKEAVLNALDANPEWCGMESNLKCLSFPRRLDKQLKSHKCAPLGLASKYAHTDIIKVRWQSS